MKVSFKCSCGAEFQGEDSGTAYSLMSRVDTWIDMHKRCINKPEQPKPITSLGHSPKCARLTKMLLSDPPQAAPCDCGFEEATNGNK